MIEFRAMTSDEFSDFVAYFVPDYATEISRNYDVDLASALLQAERTIQEDLGQGVNTPEQELKCIVLLGDVTDQPVGHLWCKPNPAEKTVFINDFYIKPDKRGRGYAREALKALDAKYRELGYSAIGLRVAADNKNAERLYLSAGYKPTGINMRRVLRSG
ncbi:MAG: GNAT family N-acetyltransferase [Marinosulfonomonas sp.]